KICGRLRAGIEKTGRRLRSQRLSLCPKGFKANETPDGYRVRRKVRTNSIWRRDERTILHRFEKLIDGMIKASEGAELLGPHDTEINEFRQGALVASGTIARTVPFEPPFSMR